MGPIFEARWDGECEDCGTPFEAGEDVQYDDLGQLVVVECCGEVA